jgi:hypothetical protein
MLLDPENGLYVFEVVLGFEVDDESDYTPAYAVQANDAEAAEEKVQEFLEEHGVAQDFWIEELSDPYSLIEYQHNLEGNGDQAHIMLEGLTEEDFQELLSG